MDSKDTRICFCSSYEKLIHRPSVFNLITRDSSQTDKLTLIKGNIAIDGCFKHTKYHALLIVTQEFFYFLLSLIFETLIILRGHFLCQRCLFESLSKMFLLLAAKIILVSWLLAELPIWFKWDFGINF